MGQGADGGGRFLAGVDQVLAQGAEDAVACGQDLDFPGPRFGNDGGRRGVDDGGDTAGLRIK